MFKYLFCSVLASQLARFLHKMAIFEGVARLLKLVAPSSAWHVVCNGAIYTTTLKQPFLGAVLLIINHGFTA